MTSKKTLGIRFAEACLNEAFGSVHHVATCASTSDLAKTWSAERKMHGAVVIASEQTQGRGRRGRTWLTHEGGLAFSVFLQPEIKASDATAYTFLAGAALMDALPQTREIYSKWPNDILVRTQKETFGKVAGILVEATSYEGAMQGVVVGIGLNVNTPQKGFPADLPWAASLDLKDEEAITHMLKAMAYSLCHWLMPAQAHQRLPKALEILRDRSALAEKYVSVTDDGQKWAGFFDGFSEEGALLLRLNKGQRQKVVTGDVNFEGYGHV